ncbi:uncharacterized protein LOC134618882 isoform X2 [Pelmatolapia mariae]|uniref:uncharacterized protein LOC134618882 isoform X2 n=1 Tax=Pelmatolapia mariae TaxID=158779 RepID=UPI002FE66E98
MKVHHTLICFFFLSLQDGNPEVTNAQFLHYGVIGGGVTAKCVHYDRQTWKMFCREECEGENILINTTDARAQTGRYSIEYYFDLETGSHGLYVSISKLTESDSGQYSCGLGGSSSSASFTPFGIFVAEALLDGNDDPAQLKNFYKETGSSLTVGCSFKHPGYRKMFCRGECQINEVLIETDHVRALRSRYNIGYESGVLYVSITQLTKSDSGRYRCFLEGTFSSSFRDFKVTVTDAGPSATTTGSSTPSLTLTGSTEQPEGAASTGLLLYVIISLLIIIILSSLTVLIICIKRKSNRGLRTRGNSEGTNMEDVHYENCTPGSTREDSTYQSLDPAGRDQDQTYFTLTRHT